MKPESEVTTEDQAAIAALLKEANSKADRFLENDTISQSKVVSIWREVYQKFKTKKGARCAVENLLKRVLKGNPVGSIAPSVDIYNTVSLTHALPVGGECARKEIAINIGDHKTTENILAKRAFTVAPADAAHVVEADYFGIATGRKVSKAERPASRS